MRVTCTQENLAKGISVVGRAVATRSTLPVLSNIMLVTDEARLKLSATNLEIGVNCWIGVKVEEEGATTVPARLLADFVGSLPPEHVDMELVTRTQTLRLNCSSHEANIKGIDAQEFPLLPTYEELTETDKRVTISPSILREMINQVSFAAATEESRPVLTGILTEFHDNSITMVAADGFRLSVRTASTEHDLDAKALIPARALTELSRIIPMVHEDEEVPVEIIIPEERSQVLFHLSSVDLITQLIEGTFPNYEQIIPKTHNTKVILDVQELLKAAKIAYFFARDVNNIVRLNFASGDGNSPGRMMITATNAEVGDNVSEMEALVEGPDIEIAFNVKYLIDVLNVIDAAQISLELSNPTSPGVIRPVGDTELTIVVMPMHIR